MKTTRLPLRFATGLLAITALTGLQAQPINVPNYSFESQVAGPPFYANPFVDSWEKNLVEPAYFGPTFGGYGIPWFGTTGTFLDTNPYANHLGTQGGYLLSFPQVTLFQDYNSTPTHDFNATYEVGKSYNLTIGIFGKSSITPGSTLLLSLYYRNDSNNKVMVGTTTVTYSAADFPLTAPLSLIDFTVNVPTVQAGDDWAGKNIGIQLESTVPVEVATVPGWSFGNWDFDNVRLTAVPEPTSLSLLAFGVGGLWLARRPWRQKA